MTLLVVDALSRISGCFVMTHSDADFCHDTFGARCERRAAEGANADITFGTYNAEGLTYEVLSAVINEIKWPPIK